MEIILSALADAILSIVMQKFAEHPYLDALRERLSGKSPEQYSLQRALAKAYMRFAEEYPELAASLFDEILLSTEAIQNELSKLLTPDQKPNAEVIAKKWFDQFAIAPAFDPIPPIIFLLDILIKEVKASPLLKPFVDSRALEQLYSIADANNQQVRIQEDLRKILEEIRDSITKATQLQNGIIVSPISIPGENHPQLVFTQSEKEFVDYWIEIAKQTKEYNEAHFQNQFRAAMMLYPRTGLPQSLTDPDSAEKFTELVSTLFPVLVNQQNENSLTFLEWGYQTMKATQNWIAMYPMVHGISAKLVDLKDNQALKWIDRLEKLIPKIPEIKKGSTDIDQRIKVVEANVHIFKGMYFLDSQLDESIRHFEQVEALLEEISLDVISSSNREFYLNNIKIAYLTIAGKLKNEAFELKRQKQFDEALQRYQAACDYAERAQSGSDIIQMMIGIAEVYKDRNLNDDFDKIQAVLAGALNIVDRMEDMDSPKDTTTYFNAMILAFWGAAVFLMDNPRSDDPLYETIKQNLLRDHKTNAAFVIKKLTAALKYAVEVNAEEIIAYIHFYMAQAHSKLEEKKEALRHIQIAINLFENQNDQYDLKLAQDLEKKYKKSLSFFGF